ncbi:dihydroxy-acid dehydratase [Nocardia vinacea]|uniref:dihydroxy-acid dehydratase domain-containing protein n=1 Tax=Nocardia vinacea TaxID=96468 RepID=UPI003AF3D3DC
MHWSHCGDHSHPRARSSKQRRRHHIAGPSALVCNGDRIRLDVPNRTVDLLVDDEELDIRRTRRRAAPPA